MQGWKSISAESESLALKSCRIWSYLHLTELLWPNLPEPVPELFCRLLPIQRLSSLLGTVFIVFVEGCGSLMMPQLQIHIQERSRGETRAKQIVKGSSICCQLSKLDPRGPSQRVLVF